MTVNISTDQEMDRILSMRMSAHVPLPPEISLSEPRDSRRYFAWMTPFRFLGLDGHPVVKALEQYRREAMMAASISRADHLDRISHYNSWLGSDMVTLEDLTRPTHDDPSGDRRPRIQEEGDYM